MWSRDAVARYSQNGRPGSGDQLGKQRLALSAAWVLSEVGGQQRLLPDHTVVVEGDRIADVTRGTVADAEAIDLPGGILLPGMINLHNHTLNAPLFRGIVDDLPRSTTGPSKVCTAPGYLDTR